MNVALQKPWTQEQFLEWAERQENRYEFDGFQPVAMTGGDAGHSRVMGNLHYSLRSRLRGGPCEPLGPDAGIETVNHAIRYPDALVTCAKFDNRTRLIPGAVAVFEVLSPSTSRIDRIVKVREYAAIPSVRRYVILESSGVGLTVMERSSPDQAWQTTVLTLGDTLRMPEIGIEIPVAEIYDGITFPDPETPEDG
jgi:Uma2 family endonuclease